MWSTDCGALRSMAIDGKWGDIFQALECASPEELPKLLGPLDAMESTLLHFASAQGKKGIQPKTINHLVVLGSDVNAADRSGQTPLHWAAAKDCGPSCIELIELGAIVDIKDCRGETPLFCATIRKNMGAFSSLMKAGADSEVENAKGANAFQWIEKSEELKAVAASIKAMQSIESALDEANIGQPKRAFN